MTTASSPSTRDPSPSTEDLNSVLARMKDAQQRSGSPSHATRIASLEKLEAALLRRKDAIVSAISKDFGHRSSHESLSGEVWAVENAIKHAKVNLREWMEPSPREVGWVFLPSSAQVLPQPVGVVGVISPWNYPVQLSLSPLVSALAAGNRVMLKPSELTPETSALLRDLLAEAFADHEVFVVTGGPEVGERFSRLPFDHLLFTGSARVGKLVMRAASENLVPVTLELGGKSPSIVGDDFSLGTAAQRIMAGKLFSAGQTCIAPDYAMVLESARDEFVKACERAVSTMYPRLRENPDYTTILAASHVARLRGLLEDAKAGGARVIEINPAHEDGLDAARKMAPALVLDPTEKMLVSQEEIFGPILPIVTYRTLDDAIAYVNARPRPLALYYFGHDASAIGRVVSETISGAVTVNETLLHILQDDLPFGGIGPSGMGHYHGRDGFETFTKKKPVFKQSLLSARGLMRPPYGKAADGLLRLLIRK